MQPLISVMVPAFNAERTIDATLDSVLKQTWRPIELVLVNDGSIDSTGGRIEKFQRQHACTDFSITTHHQPNSGLLASRRVGLKLSTGDFLQFLDADDLLHPQKFEHCMAAFAREPTDVVVPRTKHFVHDAEVETSLQTPPVIEMWPNTAIRNSSITSNLWHTAGPLFTRSVVLKAGGFPNDVHPVIEELEFHGRIKLLNPKISYLSVILNFYRKGSTSSVTGTLKRVYEGRICGANVAREMLVDAGNESFREWNSLTMMALRTVYQVKTCLPDDQEMFIRAFEAFEKILIARGRGYHLFGKCLSPKRMQRLISVTSTFVPRIGRRLRSLGS